MIALKKPAMRPRDGAVFYGSVQPTDDGRFLSACHAILELGHRVQFESREFKTLNSEAEGVKWIASRAGHRGFEFWTREL